MIKLRLQQKLQFKFTHVSVTDADTTWCIIVDENLNNKICYINNEKENVEKTLIYEI